MLVEPGESESDAYSQFWQRLNRGEYQASEHRRLAKGGREIWIEASCNPMQRAVAELA